MDKHLISLGSLLETVEHFSHTAIFKDGTNQIQLLYEKYSNTIKERIFKETKWKSGECYQKDEVESILFLKR